MRAVRTAIVIVAVLSIFGSRSESLASAVDQAVQAQLSRKPRIDVIVYLESEALLSDASLIRSRTTRLRTVWSRLRQTATASQTDLVRLLKRTKSVFRQFHIENAVVVYGANKDLIRKIAAIDGIKVIRLDVRATLHTPSISHSPRIPGARTSTPGHISIIGVDKVWKELGVKGNGIVIGGQDTGYFWEHNALREQYRGYSPLTTVHDYNWHDAIRATAAKEPFDDNGHGTHTMGTMVGFDGGANKIGVAPEAKWIGCRNMHRGVGTVSTYLECFEFFLSPFPIGGNPKTSGRPELAPHIVNNSWSCPREEGCSGLELLGAVRALRSAGIFVVAAAGNEGPGCGSIAQSPGMYSGEVFSVGAYNRYTNDIASFSSRGPSAWSGGLVPNLVSPGEIIRSSIIGDVDGYDDKSGTSMAAPQVAGVVALLWSAKPNLIGQIERTTEILHQTAKPLLSNQSCPGFPGQNSPNAVFGYGMLDAYGALKAP